MARVSALERTQDNANSSPQDLSSACLHRPASSDRPAHHPAGPVPAAGSRCADRAAPEQRHLATPS